MPARWPTHPDEDDLVALADAVREGASGVPYAGAGAAGQRLLRSAWPHGGVRPPRRLQRAGPAGATARSGNGRRADICACCPIPPTSRRARQPSRTRPDRPDAESSDRRQLRADRLTAKESRRQESVMSRPAAAVHRVIKAYDVRGLVGEEIDESFVTDVGAAFARLMRGEGAAPGGDRLRHAGQFARRWRPRSRPGSPARASTWCGSVWRPPISCTSPPGCWTAPARCSPPATTRPPTTASSCAGRAPNRSARTPGWPPSATKSIAGVAGLRRARRHRQRPRCAGRLRRRFCGRWWTPSGLRPLRVAVDAGNGMAGHTAPAVLGAIDSITLLPLYFELDGSFPNHEANPLDPANLVDLQALRASRPAPTSGWPSTATPTAASSSTSAASRCRRRR